MNHRGDPADGDLGNLGRRPGVAVASVPARSTVLDMSAGAGAAARALGRMGCRTWGVEADPELARQARRWCEGVVETAADDPGLTERFDRRFDVILLPDGLGRPGDQAGGADRLGRLVRLLADDGYLVLTLTGPDRVGTADEWFADAGLAVFFDQPLAPSNRFGGGGSWSETGRRLVLAAPAGSPAATDPPLLPALLVHQELRSIQERHVGPGRDRSPDTDQLLGVLTQLQRQSQARQGLLVDLLVSVVNEFEWARSRLPVDRDRAR